MNTFRLRIQTPFLLLAALCLATVLTAQGFYKNYLPTGSIIRGVALTPDGGYLTAGSIDGTPSLFLQKVDANGQIVWTDHKDLNGAQAVDLLALPDGNYAVLAENWQTGAVKQNVLLKINPTGQILWQQVYNNFWAANGLADIELSADGKILCAGYKQQTDLRLRLRLAKFDLQGNLLWEKITGNPVMDYLPARIALTGTGNIVVAGSARTSDKKYDYFFHKFDADGNELISKIYVKGRRQLGKDCLATPDGGFTILGETQENDPTKLDLLHLDSNGEELWYRSHYPGSATDFPTKSFTARRIALDAQGNYYLPYSEGFVNSPAPTIPLLLLKFDPDGNPLFNKSLELPGLIYTLLTPSNQMLVMGGGILESDKAVLLATDFDGEVFSNRIEGVVYKDVDENCSYGPADEQINNLIVGAFNTSGEKFYKKVNPDGTYSIRVTEGVFQLVVEPVIFLPDIYTQCATPGLAVFGNTVTVNAPQIGLQVAAECPIMDVEIHTPLLRRCTTAVYKVNYCNAGNLAATGAYVEVEKSPHFTYVSSTVPLAQTNGDILTFNLGDVASGDCDGFDIVFNVSCNAQYNDVICVNAHIFPDTNCLPNSSFFDGSKIEVEGECGPSGIEFRIKNTGSGDMTEPVEYVIIEDQIILMLGSVQLDAGEDSVFVYPATQNAACFAVRAMDNGGATKLVRPVAVVANCNGNGNLTMAQQLPVAGFDPSTATNCEVVVSSFDPNDKRGFPLGLQDQRLVDPNQELEYVIRFQNTGTDTAFLVILRDTISEHLNPMSVKPVSASHPYHWDLTDAGVLTVTFPNILLPDSNKNEVASHGYFAFRIRQQPDLPNGTQLKNRAGIYFDYNAPVITNTSLHTVQRTVSGTKTPAAGKIVPLLSIHPNPIESASTLEIKGWNRPVSGFLTLSDALGRVLRTERVSGERHSLKKESLRQGVYFLQLYLDGLAEPVTAKITVVR